MPAKTGVWGIELGMAALKAVCLRANGDQIELLDTVQIEHPKILSQPDVDRASLMNEAFKKFLDGHDVSKFSVVVSVPGQHTLARFTKLPPLEKKNKAKIHELVHYEAQQQIPFDMEEVIWDYQVFEEKDAIETRVGIFAMRRDLLRTHLQVLADFNLEPAVVQSSPLALFNALKFDGQLETDGTAILDIGTTNSDLIIVDGNSLWTRNIPIGGNHFTDTLMKTFKLSFNKAERLKRDAANNKYARQIFQAMRPVFADLVAEVQRSIGFFTSSRRGARLSRIIAMGNAFKLRGLEKFIEQNLGMDIVRPADFQKIRLTDRTVQTEPNAEGETPATPPGRLSRSDIPGFGVAYGLALQGLGKGAITSNLLPPEIAKTVVWRKKTPWFYGAAACLAAAAGVVWFRNVADAKALAAVAEGNPVSVSGVEDAARILQSPPDLNPKPFVRTIIDAGNRLSSALQEEISRNDTSVASADEILKLQTHKVLWPRILQVVHSAVPVPEPKLVEAMKQGPEAYKAAVAAIPRGKRRQIFIEKFDAVYSADVKSTYAAMRTAGSASGSTPGTAAPTDGGGPLPGFVITVTGRTPNEGGTAFVNQTLMTSLRQASWVVPAAPGTTPDPVASGSFYLDEVRYLWARRVKEDRSGIGGGTGGFASRLGAGMTGRGGASAALENINPDLDPVTGERLDDDLRFELIMVAVLGERPAATPQNQDAAGTDALPDEMQ